MTTAICLPYPPSLNHYYRHVGSRTLISKAGRDYRRQVEAVVIMAGGTGPTLDGRLDVVISIAPPDRRRRDLDNTLKALLDALQHAGVYEDDSQIDRLTVERHRPVKGGSVEVTIQTMEVV